MIDFTGAYFANLSLLEQQNLIYYLNSNWQLKCHRLDVAVDDYSRKLFPVGQMIAAFLKGDNFGFQVIDDSYLDIIDNLLVGTLGIGSRRSQLFIRIYTKHLKFVRWEAELKQREAQKLFDTLSDLTNTTSSSKLHLKDAQIALAHAAFSYIDFRDKSDSISPKNATKARTNQLFFWRSFKQMLFSSLENQTTSNLEVKRLSENA
ncbi:MAG: replication initiation factor domain-containing protein [Pleurocapsa sp. CRU_1_2]|nr:replication initiation factor domain-containing protein [Pleurocapsa sp. CRU_1_2]